MANSGRRLDELVSKRALSHLRQFRRAAERAFPGLVSDMVLFGSRARGDARRSSDYDVAVFVRDLAAERRVRHALTDEAYPHMLAGIHINPIAVPADFLSKRPFPTLAREIARDGVPVA